ncbi:MAG: D-tyrosyl-tRNA(Tyr) deacylase [Fibrobacteres bacterium]|nr:D-tyrosyl-tRNA(Tyr) deacylase [Fibrobacterota bacterium]
MRALLQRVTSASVKVDGKITGEINGGLLVFLGVGEGDTETYADILLKKLLALRIFSDENGKINLSVKDIGGKVLVVSQFTLYADTSRGNRPGFTLAAKPDVAEKLYNYFCENVKKEIGAVERGVFGADMEVSLVNDGPFTIMLNHPQ